MRPGAHTHRVSFAEPVRLLVISPRDLEIALQLDQIDTLLALGGQLDVIRRRQLFEADRFELFRAEMRTAISDLNDAVFSSQPIVHPSPFPTKSLVDTWTEGGDPWS